jgi:uncharacterized membrane protein YfcA
VYDEPDVEQPLVRPGWKPQFRIQTLLVVTLLFAVLAAVLGELLRSNGHPDTFRVFFFILLTVAAPVLVMIVSSTITGIRRWRLGAAESDEDDLID